MKRFGKSWGAPICDDQEGAPLVDAPVGEKCLRCEKPVLEDDQGVILPYYGGPNDMREIVYHLDCFLDSIGISRYQEMESDGPD